MKIHHLLGKKLSEKRKQRMKEGIARRQAKGLSFGRRRIRPLIESVCVRCRTTFVWSSAQYNRKGWYCSIACHMADQCDRRRKLPALSVVVRLYVEERLTLWQIAKRYDTDHCTVKRALIRAGVKRRKSGPFNSGICIVDGCPTAVYQIQHKGNGSWYGRRCFEHWKKHRKQLDVNYRNSVPAEPIAA